MMSTPVADDFAAIAARLAELTRPAPAPTAAEAEAEAARTEELRQAYANGAALPAWVLVTGQA